MSKLRTITADQFRRMEDIAGMEGWDEAFINGIEIWDVAVDLDEDGCVHLYAGSEHPIIVNVDHPIKVR